MRVSIIVLLISFMASPLAVRAADEPKQEQYVEVPPPPPAEAAPAHKDDDDESAADAQKAGPEPEITIINKKDAKYEEYRVNGRLYMVKVTPFIGPPYYFVDRDGDGLLETRMNGRDTQIQVPGWVILSW